MLISETSLTLLTPGVCRLDGMSNSAQLTQSPEDFRLPTVAISSDPAFLPVKSIRAHTPYDHPYFFLSKSNNASDEVIAILEGKTLRPWMAPGASRNSTKSASSSPKDYAALPQLDLRPYEYDEKRKIHDRTMSARILQVRRKKDMYSHNGSCRENRQRTKHIKTRFKGKGLFEMDSKGCQACF